VSQLARAKITALGTFVPPRLLTNDDLEKMVETSNDWIVERTGIRERHIVEKGIATSDLATEAAKRALAERALNPSDLDAIIVATVTRTCFFHPRPAWFKTSLGQKVCGDSIFPLPVPPSFTLCRPEPIYRHRST